MRKVEKLGKDERGGEARQMRRHFSKIYVSRGFGGIRIAKSESALRDLPGGEVSATVASGLN